MKKILFIVIATIVSISFVSQAQDSTKTQKPCKDEIKTIFGNKKISKGGFFSMFGGYGDMFNKGAIQAGIKFGGIADHWLSYGLTGNILVSEMAFDNIMTDKTLELEMGYVGFFFEPCLAPKFPVHFTFPITIGAGAAFFYDKTGLYFDEFESWERVDEDMFFIIEPGAEIEMNVFKHTRFGIGAKYRYVQDLNLYGVNEDDMNGLYYGFTIKFGKF
jgi:hypothetical protein